jgi:uncharacterized membrane protein
MKKIVDFIKAAFKQVWSLITDHNWDLDPWKIAGFLVYAYAVVKINDVFEIAKTVKDFGIVSTLGGLISILLTIGTFLFKQAKDHDSALIAGKPSAGQ